MYEREQIAIGIAEKSSRRQIIQRINRHHSTIVRELNNNARWPYKYSLWQRGTNENTNGLLRQYFPKGTDFKKISGKKIKKVQNELNERPRKTLNWYTPKETFAKLLRNGAIRV